MRHVLMVLVTTFLGVTFGIPAPSANAQPGVEVDWVANYSSGESPDFAFARKVAVDGSGNVYVTGSSYAANGMPDYTTVKYSSSGEILWVQRYNGPEDNWDAAWDLALDASGNVYVTGVSNGSTFFDYVTIKYSPSGTEEWVARYDEGGSDDWATALAVDAAGNVYVTGERTGPGTGSDYATLKYTPRGKRKWVALYDNPDPGFGTDRANAIVVDASGNVYVTGESDDVDTETDFATVKYDKLGAEQWAVRYAGPDDTFDQAAALALDGSGNVLVTGSSAYVGGRIWTTIKYVQTSPLDRPSIDAGDGP